MRHYIGPKEGYVLGLEKRLAAINILAHQKNVETEVSLSFNWIGMCRNGRTDRVVNEIAVEGKETMPTKESEFAIAGSLPAFFPVKEAHCLGAGI